MILPQDRILKKIKHHEDELKAYHYALRVLDEDARATYNKSLRDLPNWQITSWEELSEDDRNFWRKQVPRLS